MAIDGNLNDDLFSDSTLDNTMSFLEEKRKTGTDGLYRVDLKRVQDKNKGYRARVRFLPNFTEDVDYVKAYLGENYTEDKTSAVGPSALEKITHYVDIKQVPEFCGYYDSPKNINQLTNRPFSDKCALTDTYWTLKGSKNAILQERASMLKYSRKYFSYVLILEDDQQPDMVGKIMVFQYGITIKDKIAAERNGDITGTPCNVFNLEHGKDFVLVVKEVDTGTDIYPDYKMSQFRPETSSLSLPISGGGFKNIPLDEDNRIPTKLRTKVKEFLLNRNVELETFGPKELSDDQESKVSQIINYLTGKTSSTMASNNEPESNDFNIDSVSSNSSDDDEVDDFNFDFDLPE